MIKNNQYVVDRLYTDIATTGVSSEDNVTVVYNNTGSGLTTEQALKLAGIQSGAEVNQNAFSFVTLPTGAITTLSAISKTDTLKISATSPIIITIDDNRNLLFTLDPSFSIAQALKQLTDVDDNLLPVDKDVLYYDGSLGKWINKSSDSFKTDLTGYYTSIQTDTAISTAIANLVDSAPATLDTLNELATALGNDPNFATSITTLIGTKWTQDNTKISNWDNAYTNTHAHLNKNILDLITQSNIDVLSHLSLVDGKLKIDIDTYSTGELSAYGVGTGSGGSVTELKQLADVVDTLNPVNKDVLYFDGTLGMWTTIASSALQTDLSSITPKIPNWDLAYANTHTHANKSILDSITSANSPAISHLFLAGSGTTEDPYYLYTDIGFYSEKNISAYGIGPNGGGSGLIQTVYDSTDFGGSYNNTNYTETFNAYAINSLHNRIVSLESGSAMSIATMGSGNAVTSITKNGTIITVNYGSMFSLSNHIHTFASITEKPTTLSGYGIVDAVDITTYGNHVISNLHLTDAQRNVLALLSVVDGKLKSTADFYSEGEISAYGIGTVGGGSGLISSVYASTDLGNTYLDSNLTDTFNAYTINLLNTNLIETISRVSTVEGSITTINSTTTDLSGRITTLEGGSATSITTTGSGNAITSVTKSGTTLTFAKDSTFVLNNDYRLSNARYSPYAITFTGYSSAIYDGSNAVTVAIPSSLSQLTNDSGFLTGITKSQVEAVLTGTITSHSHNYLTGNQTISITGDVTGSGATSIALTLANSGVTIGTYRSVTVDVKGRVTAGTNPTTLSGYGIVDAANLVHTHNYAGSSSVGGKANAVANQLTFSGYSSLSYDGSTAVTIPIPNNTNQLTNGAGFITSSGNASTATALSSSRTFALTGVVTGTIASDLTSGFTINTSISANSIALGTNTVGNYAATIGVSGNGLTITGSAGEGVAYTVNSNATASNTVSTLVFRDSSGNFSAGTITAALNGNATTATTLANSRTIWGQSFNGSANVTGALSSVTDVTMSGTLSIGSAQFIYDSGTNTIRVQKSDGTAIGFYSTGEVSSYGVGSNNGTAYISKALSLSSTLTTVSDIFSGGNVHLPNERYIKGKNTTGTYYQLFGVDSANYVKFGDVGLESIFKGSGVLMSTASKTNIITLYDTIGLNANTAITGTITSTGSGTFNGGSFSSLRSLKNIHNDWSGNALIEISKLNIRDFNYKDRSNYDRTLGLIVDEIPDSIGEYILMGSNKDSVNLYTLHSLSLLAHQEELTRIEQLELEILELKQKINQLEIIK